MQELEDYYKTITPKYPEKNGILKFIRIDGKMMDDG